MLSFVLWLGKGINRKAWGPFRFFLGSNYDILVLFHSTDILFFWRLWAAWAKNPSFGKKLFYYIAKKVVLTPKPEEMKRAGRLSKADLVSGMVGEFASLQGIMGGIYADKKNEGEWVHGLCANGICQPVDRSIPSTICGAVLSMADKADTMVGCFGLGMIPTGAADPYGLRRSAIRIFSCFEFGCVLILRSFCKLEPNRPVRWKYSMDEALQKLLEFIGFAG